MVPESQLGADSGLDCSNCNAELLANGMEKQWNMVQILGSYSRVGDPTEAPSGQLWTGPAPVAAATWGMY